jgi:2-amino-4-hydroxy-6-hydroxymethyldihydropteridine diphosphokinase
LPDHVNPAGSRGDVFTGVIAYIGIGGNIGDPSAQCREAIRKLDETDGIKVLRTSSFYRTEPIGVVDQDWFINAVSEIRTMVAPRQLLTVLKDIEKWIGRKEGPRWGPRVIDLDILLYGQRIIDEEGLNIPHPEMHKRRFVLEPLCEIASYVIHPMYNISAQGLLSRLPQGGNKVLKMDMRG